MVNTFLLLMLIFPLTHFYDSTEECKNFQSVNSYTKFISLFQFT